MKISPLEEIKLYTGKCFRLFVFDRQWRTFLSTLLIMGIISLATGDEMFLTYRATHNGAFAIVCACIWIGLFNSIQSICRERDVVKREHHSGMRISSYVVAHAIYELAICAAEALIVTMIVMMKNRTHLPPEGLIFPMSVDLYVTFLLVIFSSDLLALLISGIVRTPNTAMTVMPFVLIIQLVMSGAVFSLEGVSKKISEFTVSRYGLHAIEAIANTDEGVLAQYLQSGALAGSDATGGNLFKIWLRLLCFAILYLALTVPALSAVEWDKR